MGQLLRILVVEDSEEDSFLLLRELHRAGYEPVSERVASAESMAAALDRQSWDIIISDYVLPGFGGLEALDICRQRGLDVPFLLVSGHIGEDIAVSAIQGGADDYLMKDRLARLGSAVGRALERAEIRREHKRSIEANGEVILQIRNDGKAFPVRCEANNRLGLKIMDYRARTIGGTLHIRPNGNAGTIVTCRIPALDHFSGAAPDLGAAAGTQNGEHRRPANLLEQTG